MTLSVIVPLYNKERSVKRTLDSIVAQTYRDFEVIVVDDGSTDNGLQVVRGVGDPRVRIVCHANSGPGAARNLGAELACGEYLAFLDADDEWAPAFLRSSLDALQQHADCGFSISAFLDGPERRNSQVHLDSRGYRPGRYVVGPDTAANTFDWLLHAYLPSTAVFRRAAFEDSGRFYQKDRCCYGEDMYLFVTAALRHPFVRLGEPLVWYHREDSQLAHQQMLTPLLTDPAPAFALCPERNRPVLRGLLADRAIQEALRLACAGTFAHTDALFAQFISPEFLTRRARNARRQIRAMQWVPKRVRAQAGDFVPRVLQRLFPLLHP